MTTPTQYIQNLTGLSADVLFNPTTGLVGLSSDTNNNISVAFWNVPNVPQPTQAQIMAAVVPPAGVDGARLVNYVSSYRSQVANAGTTINIDPQAASPNNVFASTDSESLTLLSGSLQYVQINPSATINWVTSTGTVVLNASEIATLASAVFAFIQKTFTVSGLVLADVNSGVLTSETAIQLSFNARMAQ